MRASPCGPRTGTRMTELCYGMWHCPLPLSATRRYDWTELRSMCKQVLPPYALRVEGQVVPVVNEAQLVLACKVAAAYHDWVAYNVPEDDGFQKDMQERETRIAAELGFVL